MSQEATPVLLRWSVRALAGVLTVLLIWLFGYVLSDIDKRPGPSRHDFESQMVESSLIDHEIDLKKQLEKEESAIKRQKEIQARLEESMANAGQTLNQMTELQRFRRENGESHTAEERAALTRAQTRFMDAQDAFEAANVAIADREAKRFELGAELQNTQQELKEKRRLAYEAWQDAWDSHRYNIGAIKLAFIVPVLLLSAFLYRKKRKSVLRPIILAFLLASFWRVGVVMHDHFPTDFFKYIALGASIAIVLAFLVFLLRTSAKPDTNALIKRRREAYQRGICSECGFPFAGKAFGRVKSNFGGEDGMKVSHSYVCPSCSSSLFSTCNACDGRRHDLLPYCVHCGDDGSTE